jgi:hypothetical protein
MVKTEPWYLTERAEQLAIVYLSRRDELVISRQRRADYGVDFLVSLTEAGAYTGRVFGVQVKALTAYQQAEHVAAARDEITVDLQGEAIPAELPFPFCLFVFVMEDDAGYYTWIKKPAYGFDNRPRLILSSPKSLKRLDNEAIAQIVKEVAQWYAHKIKIPA